MVILAIGPHPDDIELGCYGTLAKYKILHHAEIQFLILTSGENAGDSDVRREEAEKSAALLNATIIFLNERDGYVTHDASTVGKIKAIIDSVSPEMIFIPFYKDTHQDHVACSLSVISASHGKESLFMYETPSTYGMTPNSYCDVGDYIDLKLKSLKIHQSQSSKIYFDEDLIKSRLLYYGWKNRIKNYLEAFYVYRQFLISDM